MSFTRPRGQGGPHSIGVETAGDGKVGVRVDDKSFGRILAPPASKTPTPGHSIQSDCGRGGWALLTSREVRWLNATYSWYYNPAMAPSGANFDLIRAGLNYATADSSSCGHVPTSAKWSYKGTSPAGAGNKNGMNSIGWYDLEALGVTVSYFVGGTLQEADIRFDSKIAGSWHHSLSLPVPSGRHDFVSVATHEVLHAYGLGHVDDTSNVMYESLGSGPGSDRRTKRTGELLGMRFLYP